MSPEIRSFPIAMGGSAVYKASMWICRIGVAAVLLVVCAACAARHGADHVAPDESRPHISWEIRVGGDVGDGDFVCASAKSPQPCVMPASTDETPSLATVHLLVHAAAQPTSYLGFMRAPFFGGEPERKLGEVNATVQPGDEPIGKTVVGRVTSTPGTYTLTISVDATHPGPSVSCASRKRYPLS